MKRFDERVIFERSVSGRRGVRFATTDAPGVSLGDILGAENLRKDAPRLPEVSELDAVRHYTGLSKLNFSVDGECYPLGSCTMKYNPKSGETIAALPGFTDIHPMQDESDAQGALELLCDLTERLSVICGMDGFTLQPAAGAHGEMTGLMMMAAYHRKTGSNRNVILVPDSAHGTNPASAALAGFKVKQIPSLPNGLVDLEALKGALGPDIAGLMLTNPNTLGRFEKDILEISRLVHEAGGLLYYDGANLNAVLGQTTPGAMGFDVVHLNLHKTFATPHGGGGPGAGPVGVKKELLPFLPVPIVKQEGGRYRFDSDLPDSIGKVRSFYGNYGVLVKAYAYICSLGGEGLRRTSQSAVLAANYLRAKLEGEFKAAGEGISMHEFVFSAAKLKSEYGVTATDVAKALIERGFHPPTVYFPLTVEEAMMFEPTETESIETLDSLVDAMKDICRIAKADPASLHETPTWTPIGRADDVKAARDLKIKFAFS